MKTQTKFDTLYKQIINEDYSNDYHKNPFFVPVDKKNPGVGINLKKMNDSVGWDIDAGITGGKVDAVDINKDSVKFVSFDQGAKEVLQHAKQYNADPEELNELKKRLLNFKKEWMDVAADSNFITFSVETDVNLGVVWHG